METKLQHPLLGEIVLCQTRRARRISLSVRSTGGVRLSFPCNVPRARALAFLESKTDWVIRTRDRLAARAAAHPAPDSCDIEALRSAAKAELPTRVEELARLHGFRYGRVTIRASRTKWGCCTGDNNLSLSLFLMTLPRICATSYCCTNSATPSTTTTRPISTHCSTGSPAATKNSSAVS